MPEKNGKFLLIKPFKSPVTQDQIFTGLMNHLIMNNKHEDLISFFNSWRQFSVSCHLVSMSMFPALDLKDVQTLVSSNILAAIKAKPSFCQQLQLVYPVQ